MKPNTEVSHNFAYRLQKRGKKRGVKKGSKNKILQKALLCTKDTCKSQNTDCYLKKQWDEHISMQAVLHVYWIVTLVLSSLALCISCWSEVHYFLSVSNKSLVIACYRCQDFNPQTLQLKTPRAAVITHSQVTPKHFAVNRSITIPCWKVLFGNL